MLLGEYAADGLDLHIPGINAIQAACLALTEEVSLDGTCEVW
jgi:hypothetical protein